VIMSAESVTTASIGGLDSTINGTLGSLITGELCTFPIEQQTTFPTDNVSMSAESVTLASIGGLDTTTNGTLCSFTTGKLCPSPTEQQTTFTTDSVSTSVESVNPTSIGGLATTTNSRARRRNSRRRLHKASCVRRRSVAAALGVVAGFVGVHGLRMHKRSKTVNGHDLQQKLKRNAQGGVSIVGGVQISNASLTAVTGSASEFILNVSDEDEEELANLCAAGYQPEPKPKPKGYLKVASITVIDRLSYVYVDCRVVTGTRTGGVNLRFEITDFKETEGLEIVTNPNGSKTQTPLS